jgi:hypothetical protein
MSKRLSLYIIVNLRPGVESNQIDYHCKEYQDQGNPDVFEVVYSHIHTFSAIVAKYEILIALRTSPVTCAALAARNLFIETTWLLTSSSFGIRPLKPWMRGLAGAGRHTELIARVPLNFLNKHAIIRTECTSRKHPRVCKVHGTLTID